MAKEEGNLFLPPIPMDIDSATVLGDIVGSNPQWRRGNLFMISPLDSVLQLAWDRQRASLRPDAVTIKALVDEIHTLDIRRADLIDQLTKLVEPTSEEYENVYMMYREDGKYTAEYITELTLPLVVLDDRQCILDDELFEGNDNAAQS